jgi:hypothetical protein
MTRLTSLQVAVILAGAMEMACMTPAWATCYLHFTAPGFGGGVNEGAQPAGPDVVAMLYKVPPNMYAGGGVCPPLNATDGGWRMECKTDPTGNSTLYIDGVNVAQWASTATGPAYDVDRNAECVPNGAGSAGAGGFSPPVSPAPGGLAMPPPAPGGLTPPSAPAPGSLASPAPPAPGGLTP